MKCPLPKTSRQWLKEINLAIAEARGTSVFQAEFRTDTKDVNLYHLAPIVCLKFRGRDYRDQKLRERVTVGALATYVANSDPDGIDHGLETRPLLAFAVCYLTSHYVLDLLDAEKTEKLLNYCEEHLDELG